MARWKNINGVLQKIAGSVRIDQVLNKLSRNAISNKAVSEKFEEVDTALDSHQDQIDEITPLAKKWKDFGSAVNIGSTAKPYYFGFDGGQNNIYPVHIDNIKAQVINNGFVTNGRLGVQKVVGVNATAYANAHFWAGTNVIEQPASRAMYALENIGSNAVALYLQTDSTMHIRTHSNVDYQFNMTQVSSRRIKENVESISEEDATKLLDLDVVSFDYIEPYRINSCESAKQYGLIAEDVVDAFPHCVVVPLDYNKDDEDDITNVMSIKYEKLVPQLLKLVQIQQKQIDDLIKKVEYIENSI